ncbi:MAG: alpha/beta hydrolase [Candidatus Thorarchaeota archaeon]
MNLKRILRFLCRALCYAILGTFTAVTVLYLFFDTSTFGWLVAILYSSIAPALFVICVSCGIIIIRFSFMKNRNGVIVISVLCLFLFITAITPYAAIPGAIADAESQMNETYGSAYTNLDASLMLPVPYSLYDNIYGVPIDESKFSVQENIEYFDNGVDKFFFDWYRPSGEGLFPVIISLHGGAWVIGDKGRMNVILFNRYFASQGYAVFDLNYGLFDVSTLSGEAASTFGTFAALGGLSPDYNASYTLQQQIENIGEFTKMLDLNDTKYSADMDNVFVVGRSAGGHMASLVTLGYANPLYAGNFSTNMTVKGGIWIYPPTNFTRSSGSSFFDPMMQGSLPIEEQYNKMSAAYLITNSTITPPIIIVQGSKDGLVDYGQGLSFYQYATGLGKKCLFITIPWAGHAFDFLFQSYGGQISTYYIERFVALELGGA